MPSSRLMFQLSTWTDPLCFLTTSSSSSPSTVSAGRYANVHRHVPACARTAEQKVIETKHKNISINPPIRDILAVTLRLPQAVTTATKREELEVISAMGAGS